MATDYWNQKTTRYFQMPDQTTRLITLTNCHWAAYDHIVSAYDFTPEMLIEMALHDAKLIGISFEEIFADGIAHIDIEMGKLDCQ